MKYIFTLFLLSLLVSDFYAQDTVETVRLSKHKTKLYRGLGQELQDWYVFVDQSGTWYMANLFIPKEEINSWFESKKDSQNILKGILNAQGVKTLMLMRENEPENAMRFYVETNPNMELVLIQIESNQAYVFEEIFVR